MTSAMVPIRDTHTPAEFAKQRRLSKAHEMLTGGVEQTVMDVALSCGFNDGSHFSKEYLKAFGALPSRILRDRR